ncbi:MAG: tRNA lysidine(34) synthetase TilS [Deltaproteobacteria bacterium]|jgi:tRNA(Ile)-lysidine synthase|nr:tRNA lysidine(34) synthetase TilS [Deltaproteobacteria bacterium]
MAALCPQWPEGRYVCAFSGGSDSTALLALLGRFLPPERLMAAHLDHALRESSAIEAQKARATAESLGLRIALGRTEVEKLARERGKGLEEAARAARYGFLLEELGKWPGDFVATAHQAEDQAETVIMKLARGAGPGAMVGIRARFGKVVRPLLGESRQALRGYLEERGLGFVTDPSNEDQRFMRNLVRQKVLPSLAELNPAYLAAFGRAADLAVAEEEYWEWHVKALLEKLGLKEDQGWHGVKAEALGDLSLAEKRRVFGRLARMVSVKRPGGGEPVSFLAVETMVGFLDCPGAGGLDLPGGRRVEWRGQYLYVGPASRFDVR